MSASITKRTLAGLFALLVALLMVPGTALAADLAAQAGDLDTQANGQDEAPWTDWADTDVIFTVYQQAGSEGVTVAKEFTKAELVELAKANTESKSYLFTSKGGGQVATATEYVTYEQLLDAAGLTFSTGMTLSFADDTGFAGEYVYQDLNSDLKFFPAWDGSNRSVDGAVDAPLILALKWDAAAIEDTAGTAAQAAGESAYHASLRNLSGWKEDHFAEAGSDIGGKRFVKGATSLTVKVPVSDAFTVYTQTGAGDTVAAKEYDYAALSKLATVDEAGKGFLFNKGGWQVGVTTLYVPVETLLADALGSDFALNEDTTLIATAGDGFSTTLSYSQVKNSKYFFPATTTSSVDATNPIEVGTVLALKWITTDANNPIDGTAGQTVAELAPLATDGYRIFTGLTQEDYLAGKNNGGNRFATSPIQLSVVTVKDIADPSVTIEGIDEHYAYTGEAIEPYAGKDFTIKDGDVVLQSTKKRTDYSLTVDGDTTNAGTVTLTIQGKNAYKGSRTLTYTIDPIDLGASEDVVVSDIADQAMTGSAVRPAFSVTYKGEQLYLGEDYTVKYANNDAVGTASVTIKGIGNYAGSKTVEFNIKKNIADADVAAIAAQTYNGKAMTPAAVVTDGTTALTVDKDYSIEYANNVNAGTAKVTITGMGDYVGTKTASFTIKKAANPMKVANSSAKFKAKKLKKKAQTIAAAKAAKVSGNLGGKVTYKLVKANKSKAKFKVASNGKITVKKGLKKGTYKLTIAATAAANANYEAATSNFTVTVKVTK